MKVIRSLGAEYAKATQTKQEPKKKKRQGRLAWDSKLGPYVKSRDGEI